MFLISLTAISALGVIAGGSFWTAQSMYKLTDNKNYMNAKFCSTSAASDELDTAIGGVTLMACP